MPVPWFPAPPTLSPIRLYRHILREASYLPPAFRTNIIEIIRHRFRSNLDPGPHDKTRIYRARNVLRTLRAANSGDMSAMKKLILLGFARSGSPRRELMSQFVKPQGPSNSKALDALIDDKMGKMEAKESEAAAAEAIKVRKPKNDFFTRWDRPKLLQLLKSQKQQQAIGKMASNWPAVDIKSFNEDQFLPETNTWGKPPSEILTRAKRAKWWKLTASKILPPLGRGRWELLGQLSEGAQDSKQWEVPTRRRPVEPTDAPVQWDWRAYASQPADVIQRPKSWYNQRRSGQTDTGPHGLRPRKTWIPSRWFRRQYNRTWLATATMDQNANTLRHSISWGRIASKAAPATTAQLEIFQGVNEKGEKTSS
ncbi:hypothetical protein L249_5010 [Ophiocordyceps polyrhachis-furcata BCC 54312]|uniref:LYR motif-containing protein Cup1-like N-terminal domain-containing protein n=1 Tax=Ophiocordyceps polyrhachis-furcata BCC 54312 TaxID=1330021 RepID=A0A367L3I2_9HYPO|nr:hypothetical protein L249_5010 [Ophiocordyceps polyrhachis-furcata BCC 54312]